MLTLFQNYLNSIHIDFVSEGGTILFKENNLRYLFIYDGENDPYYFRLMLPKIVQISDQNREVVLNAINYVNSNFKVAKAIIVNTTEVWASVEQFVYSREQINDLFARLKVLLEAFIADFRAHLAEPLAEIARDDIQDIPQDH